MPSVAKSEERNGSASRGDVMSRLDDGKNNATCALDQ